MAVLAFWYLKIYKNYPRQLDLSRAQADYWGITYSHKLAQELDLDWPVLYQDILDDLEVRYIRLPFYWDDIEPRAGEFDFGDYDYLLSEGAEREVKFIANIGWRLPRWPECHTPTWLAKAESEEIKRRAVTMLMAVVERYKDNSSIIAWQVENEPLLDAFGECPPGDLGFLKKEVDLVRSKDSSRPIIISASGELSWWGQEAELADILGTTMYRVVWNRWVGYFHYSWPAWYYQLKAKRLGLKDDQIIISELQAEPWVPQGTLRDLRPEEARKSFDLQQFRANLQYAIEVDFKQSYLWGVEWWYLQKLRGYPEYWDLAREIFANN